MPNPRDHIFSEYLENEEVYIRTAQWKFVFGSGRRARRDGYETDHPTPGLYQKLFHLIQDAGEFTNLAATHPALVARFQGLALTRFRDTHPDREREPHGLSPEESLAFYLAPRDKA